MILGYSTRKWRGVSHNVDMVSASIVDISCGIVCETSQCLEHINNHPESIQRAQHPK